MLRVEGPWLVALEPVGATRPSNPLAENSLHRVFSSLELTQEAIKRFADRYGLLGHPRPVRLTRDKDRRGQGEPLSFWKDEIQRLAKLLELWELAKAKRLEDLRQYITWERRPRAVCLHADLADGGVIFSRLEGADCNGWEVGDVVGPARSFIHAKASRVLGDHGRPEIPPIGEGEAHFRPDCLLSSLYLLFNLEISGRKRLSRQCPGEECHIWFTPRNDRQVYHDLSCRRRTWHHKSPSSPKNRKL